MKKIRKSRAKNLNLLKVVRWTKEDDKLLTDNYQLTKEELLKLFPNRTSQAINIRASLLGLRKIHNEYCESNLSILLEDTEESYYWIGFILADGCFGGVGANRLTVGLAKKDAIHLIKMSTYLGTSYRTIKNGSQFVLSCQDKLYSPEIRKKFDINRAKTYNPPLFIPDVDKTLLFAMYCGLLDGDGCIRTQTGRNDHYITLKCHPSWIDYYKKLDEILFKSSNTIKINKSGYMIYTIYSKVNIQTMVDFAKNCKLPLLERKWQPLFNEYEKRQEKCYKYMG